LSEQAGGAIGLVRERIVRGDKMVKVALYVRLEAKPGKEKDVAQFLEAGLGMANQETTTPVWFALQLSPSVFGIFDAFDDESGRQAHLNGPIAKALMANAGESTCWVQSSPENNFDPLISEPDAG
jgi:quinol monooxygenase YgiN